MILDIRRKIERLPVDVEWEWVEGHQDDHVNFAKLSPLAQDNVQVDLLAKRYLKHCITAGITAPPQQFGDEGCAIFLSGKKLSHLDQERLYEHATQQPSKKYWARKHEISRQTIDFIDWDCIKAAMTKLPFNQQRRIIKHTTGKLAVGKKPSSV